MIKSSFNLTVWKLLKPSLETLPLLQIPL
ncbi:hypothetical protein Gohar_022545 [Gossypium harknessii]|uniref:Uncharacterized protein n=2 Tax=Gossypium TaxID=3633 RepID=A0A7J9A6T8_9ROSI|nr:hypothetical protein [Gossypium laxum]MBA0806681.1 hypothetical protein [Gossypium harknessii]